MQVEGQRGASLLALLATGARVRNTYPIYPCLRDSPSKDGLIPDGIRVRHLTLIKDLSDMDEDAYD